MNDRATLEISLAAVEEGGHSVELRFAQPGDQGEPNRARGKTTFRLSELRALWAQPKAYGQLLTGCLLAEPALRSFFDQALAIAQKASWVLRLRLCGYVHENPARFFYQPLHREGSDS